MRGVSRNLPGRFLATAAVLVATALVVGGLFALEHRASSPGRVSSQPPSPQARAATRNSIGFRTPELLAEHYRKHGREFGSASMEEYLLLAQTLRDARSGGPVLELRRPDGVIVRFDRRSGAFVAFDSDGTLHTFFKPRQGEAYFQRQRTRSWR